MIKKLVKNLIMILAVIAFIFSINIMTVFAVTQDDINSVKNEIDKNQEELDSVEEELTGTLKQIQDLQAQISDYENDIEELNVKIEELETKISEAEIQLQETIEKYEEQKVSFGERMVAIYEAGETTYLDVLLSSDDIVDFITNYYLVEEMAECDNNMLDLMEKSRIQIETTKTTLEENKQQIEVLKNNKQSTMSALESSKITQENYAEQLTEDEKLLKEEIEKLKEQQDQMEAELAEQERNHQDDIDDLTSSGQFQRPVIGGVVTCNMYYSSGKYHGAMDIGIPVGTKVYAAEEGIVLQAGWNNTGYGYLTVIQHADGLRTYYGHGNGTIYVEVGQKVEKGQLIMLSGNTGNSTGPHLHFEVRVAPYSWVYGGGPGDCRRDPRNYL